MQGREARGAVAVARSMGHHHHSMEPFLPATDKADSSSGGRGRLLPPCGVDITSGASYTHAHHKPPNRGKKEALCFARKEEKLG